ncbi:methyltransferase domain-containing protein [Paenibacillus protaetiae]|uniref:Methyltransferase domain-containing protein n=1 Tax=Paenibacillus protaetiae TaxID=2509456 RepID=A0A4P6EUY5_9BACL|nr:methyltransferase domain-containing protein [Paenibacillus protaetiae]QAY66784.1 methyltransferase domain-containing protein [Paenibacillus protaetiae]
MSGRTASHWFDNIKEEIKDQRTSRQNNLRFAAAILPAAWNAVRLARRVMLDHNYRSILRLQLFNHEEVHQTSSTTFMNRYPAIFTAAKNYFAGKPNLNLLSYGCSTGEEVLTLRQYFPNARIIGAEINKRSLHICRSLPVDDQIAFIKSTSEELAKHGPYDAIFCMAVLQRKPHDITDKGITDLSGIYPFEKFERQVNELNQLVMPSGLLIIHFTQYSFLDTAAASYYKVMEGYSQHKYPSHVFDKNSKLALNKLPYPSIFIKTNT